ncbi:MAG TPA: tryptophan 2,3-dioxygenase family protein [Gaiellaceae bacterium]|nr:tryptophan 2,3-dioxygenase family protein [Gaiellaceae bacterium]
MTDDEFAPILPGAGASDYERYLRTDELLALQKTADEWVHRDELLFQTVHQSSELWLKHAWNEVEEATRLVESRDVAAALRLLRRATACVRYVIGFLEHLELMSPWEYQEVRRVLGHGSGFDSPGFREIRRVSPPLYAAFDGLRKERGLSLVEVYTQGREHEDVYQLAELLVDWDEQVGIWRFRHVKMVGRVIGEDVVGTQGTPVELLAGLIKNKMFPELWRVRTELTELARESD